MPKRPRRGGAGAAKPHGRFTPQMGGLDGVLGSDEQSMSAAKGKIAVDQQCLLDMM